MTGFVVGYARTSGDEADTGQDVQAQAAQLRVDVPGLSVVHVDDGVSGSVPPMERPGFARAVHDLVAAGGGVLVARDLKRVGRAHPAIMAAALDALARQGVRIEFTNDAPLPPLLLEDQSEVDAGMGFFRFYGPWAELVSGRRTTRAVMAAFKREVNPRPTKSGKPVGRPTTVSDAEARRFYPVAAEVGAAEAARRLGRERGWRPDQDPRTQKKYRVPRTSLLAAFKRVGLVWPCVQNQDVSKMVSDKQEEACDDNGSVFDGPSALRNRQPSGNDSEAPPGESVGTGVESGGRD